ncbi:dockerin type I domain-containing protein [Gottfriedia sp. NPDC056225]|uniref:dockerin type I domain-containing protein n=1 Tax=Gottfriedia sp. NPDC056225 TaxID=3345751 RepID=UPI0035DE0C5E
MHFAIKTVEEGINDRESTFQVPNLPLADDTHELQVNIPGHFTIEFHEDEKVTHQDLYLYRLQPSYAGDVNKDDVINVMDTIYLQTYWGTNKREADINFDGVVDEKDMAYLENNYLMQNPTINYAPTPKTKYKGQTLETVKSVLGIN